MKEKLSILLAQINLTVGDIHQNKTQIIEIIRNQQNTHDILIFPELTLSGYSPEDLLLRPEFNLQIEDALQHIQKNIDDCYVVIGHPIVKDGCLLNRASVYHNKQCILTYDKHHLPNYGVFDEKRYFTQSPICTSSWIVKGHRIGLCICEDIWQPGPVEQHLADKTELLIVINASPFDVSKPLQRENKLAHYAKQGLAMIYLNLVGGQDELVFDGQSLVFNAKGELCARLPAFRSHLETIKYFSPEKIQGEITISQPKEALMYEALCCGLRDYVHKNNFKGVLLGLSGGIDSALTLAIAVDCLGAENVLAVMMPSRYSASMSHDDAMQQVKSLNVQSECISIEPVFEEILTSLQPSFIGKAVDLTEENIQARIRGLFLMALSNKFGKLVLATSNKSESAVGYATLYGDMCGGFSVLKDVLKTEVYALARYRNTIAPVIPERVLERAPTAELRFNQTDQDNLPEYAILDEIIVLHIEKKCSASDIIARGFAKDTVHRVLALIANNEYKRRQSAPGVKISPCAFGKERRYPITSGFQSK